MRGRREREVLREDSLGKLLMAVRDVILLLIVFSTLSWMGATSWARTERRVQEFRRQNEARALLRETGELPVRWDVR
ncbi:MAG: hypothetical protein HY548_10240 [Elusimicrobia bacterium]|nr:hypothetical protein [Elusimicrobiota bacterium]